MPLGIVLLIEITKMGTALFSVVIYQNRLIVFVIFCGIKKTCLDGNSGVDR